MSWLGLIFSLSRGLFSAWARFRVPKLKTKSEGLASVLLLHSNRTVSYMRIWHLLCCTRLVKIQDAKNYAKNRHLRTIAQLCRAISSQLRHVSTIGKKLELNSNISSTCSHNMVNFGPLAAEIVSGVWGTPATFNGFRVWQRYCTDVAQRKSTKLCTMFGRLLSWYTI